MIKPGRAVEKKGKSRRLNKVSRTKELTPSKARVKNHLPTPIRPITPDIIKSPRRSSFWRLKVMKCTPDYH